MKNLSTKIIIAIIIIAIALASGAFALIKIKTKGNNAEEVKTNGIDYLVLVNKQNQLPNDWEEKVQLVTAKDAWGDDIKVEKEAYEKYTALKSELEKEGVYIELDSCYQ